MRAHRGQVEVRSAGAEEWRKAGPLLTLRAGDAVRVSEEASVVILLSGGRGSVTVTKANSPFIVAAPRASESTAQKAVSLLEASLNFLATTSHEEPRVTLSMRGGPNSTVILTPRNGLVLPDSVAFEWLGSHSSRYTVRILGSDGALVLEKTELAGARFDYPTAGPPLRPGVRYTFQVVSTGHPVQQAWFEVADPAWAQQIRREMKEMEQAAGASISHNTLTILRAGHLARYGLLHDARLVVIQALAKDPEEPTLHLLLGNLYARMGLPEQANRAYSEARFLVTGPTKQ